jgi:hypothetical protein
MMKLQGLNKYLIYIVLVGFSSAIWATPYPNPLPGILDGDIDGTGFFNPGDVNTSLEIYDLAEVFETGYEFGFCFGGGNQNSDTSLLNAIFGAEDFTNFNPLVTTLALAHPQYLLQFKPGIPQWALPVT